MKLLSRDLLLAGVMAFGACANVGPSGPTRNVATNQSLISRYDAVAIRAAATGLGYRIVADIGAEQAGGPLVRIEAPDELSFGAFGVSCEGGGSSSRCDGIQLVSSFDFPTKAEFDADAFVSRVNRKFSVVKMVRLDNRLTFSRYLIMDDGISPGNLSANLEVFVQVLGYVTKSLRD